MHKAIQTYLADLLPICAKEGLQLVNEREIPYGVQLEFTSSKATANLNVYFSIKKGISTVISTGKGNPLKPVLDRCIGKLNPVPEVPLHDWQHWVGSDECGKGDLFGPLVVCGFYMDKSDAHKLQDAGVCDSKKLNKAQIDQVARKLYQSFPQNIECLILKPKKYNELYASFASQSKNLNDLLAWCHCKILDNLIKRHSGIEGVFIDQFSSAKKATALLGKQHPDMRIIERPNGERDLAVAAASIIARYQLVQSFQSMNRYFDLKLPMGASAVVIDAARSFIAQYGRDRLGEIAKLHFKTIKVV